jgi:hypothetical protein
MFRIASLNGPVDAHPPAGGRRRKAGKNRISMEIKEEELKRAKTS